MNKMQYFNYFKCLIILMILGVDGRFDYSFNANKCDMSALLQNGRMRFRQNGRIVRFTCRFGYELVGQRFVGCVGGLLDGPPPICVRPGCKNLAEPENGILVLSRRKAVAMFFCKSGYSMAGESNIFCDGVHWNGTTPTCEKIESRSEITSCEFEDQGLCGWKHDQYHDFDWIRKNKNTPSGHVKTGPSYDHTLGEWNAGYYMYIESTGREVNDSARLISPLFSPSLTQDGCFIFYYHMYGRATGTLRVLVHPVSQDLGAILSDPELRVKYTMFEKSGDQGDTWFKGFFDLDVLTEDFQIVIEGIRGSSYTSDIAIDDLSIKQGEECANQNQSEVTSSGLESSSSTPGIDSCSNRCEDSIRTISIDITCLCYSGCEDQHLCCVDYLDLCTGLASEDSSTVSNSPITMEYTSRTSSTYKTDKITEIPTTTPSTTTSNPTTDTTIKTTLTTVKPTTIRTTTRPPTTVTSTTKRPTTKLTQKPTTKTTLRTTLTTKRTTVKPTTLNTTPRTTTSLKPIQIFIPVLRFATPTPPIKNVTGILKKAIDEVEPLPQKGDEGAITTVSPRRVTQTLQRGSTKAVPMTARYSKTYEHYSKIFRTTTESRRNMTEEPDFIEHISIRISGPMRIFLLISAVAVVVAAVSLMIIRSNQILQWFEKSKLKILRKRSSSLSSDMRFLVENEELEHDFND